MAGLAVLSSLAPILSELLCGELSQQVPRATLFMQTSLLPFTVWSLILLLEEVLKFLMKGFVTSRAASTYCLVSCRL